MKTHRMRPAALIALLLVVCLVLGVCGVYLAQDDTSPAAARQGMSSTPTPTIPPGVTYGPIVSPGPTLAPTGSPPPSATPSGGPYGPIVGPGHTLVPTETRRPPTLPPTVMPTAGPSPTPMPTLSQSLMGVQIHPHISQNAFDEMLRRARELNLAWVKFQFNWSLLESAPGQYTELFYMLRLYVQQAHTQGFKVLVGVAKAPGWSRTPDPDGIMHEDGPPDDPQVLVNFLSGMLTMIGVDVLGHPYIDAIEIWNEANLRREWYGHPISGEEYMRYFRPAFDTVQQFSPEITVITAAPAPTGDSDESINDRNWLQQLYGAGLAPYGQYVAVGVHPYGWANAPSARCCANPSRGWDDQPQFFFLDTIEDYHSIMVANGHTNAQLWATEFGWATFDGLLTRTGTQPFDPLGQEFYSFINQWQQADFIVQAFYLAQDRPYMGPMILWNLNFAAIPNAVDQSDPKAGYGILNNNWQPRPAYLRLQQAPKQ